MRPTKVNFHRRNHSPTRLTLADQSRIKTSHYVSDPKVVNHSIPLPSETEPEVPSVIPLERVRVTKFMNDHPGKQVLKVESIAIGDQPT
jgi:hypothetical protein